MRPMPKLDPVFNLEPFCKVQQRLSEAFSLPVLVSGNSMETLISFKVTRKTAAKLKSGEWKLVFLCANASKQEIRSSLYYPSTCKVRFGYKTWMDGFWSHERSKSYSIETMIDLTSVWQSDFAFDMDEVPGLAFKYTALRGTMIAPLEGGIYTVKVYTDAELMIQLTRRRYISITDAKKIITGESDNLAIQAVHSLIDPISGVRIKTPIRSRTCRHLDCFDAETFLLFQRKNFLRKCPHCNSPFEWKSLAIDELMLDIVNNTESSTCKVAISRDATWTALTDNDHKRSAKLHYPEREVIDLLGEDEEVNENDDEIEVLRIVQLDPT